MREIKFRGIAIQEEYGMVYGDVEVFRYAIGGNKTVLHDFNDWGLNSSVEIKQNTLGQFTGLKDKNGTEIYEGDILKWNNGVISFVEYTIQQLGYVVQIGVSSGKIDNTCEVIGNIYENPELLPANSANE